jgi:Ca-activated chloride channel homolog
MVFRFAYPYVFLFLVPVFVFLIFWRLKYFNLPRYIFSLTDNLFKHGVAKKHKRNKIYFFLRSIVLLGLIFLIARPQWVDKRSNINVDGIDIVIALDVSGSMRIFDDVKDRRARIEVAKMEVLRFIEKRMYDPIGIVIFGADAVSRCPLTLDKNVLKEIVSEVKLGIINYEGTALGTGMATAINRLRNSKSKSKIIILLTDGRPEGQDKISPELATDLAIKFGIKIYTIGVGNKNGGYIVGSFGFVEQIPDSIDEQLLKKIAYDTGGQFFRANNAAQMRQIYNTIDSLEKTEYQTDVFNRYYESFFSLMLLVLLFLFAELLLRLWLWRGL